MQSDMPEEEQNIMHEIRTDRSIFKAAYLLIIAWLCDGQKIH
uniref:Uncharacterized protein n=1 Tax=Onchocerca volvulus TaxID=6282 RepID=A0A8R1TP82_ONCVO